MVRSLRVRDRARPDRVRTINAGAIVASLVALLVVVFPLAAQQGGVVEGRVTAAGSGEPLGGVTVQISATSLGAITNDEGVYRIQGVPAGVHEVSIRRIGLRPQTVTIRIQDGAAAVVNFQLENESVLLPDMVVSTTREAQRISETASTVGVVSAETLQEVKPRHPADVMGLVPGVLVNVAGGSGEGHMTAIRQPITTNPVYLFLENGVPTRSTGFFNHNALYEVNVPQAERIEVLKGPATALYGSDAIGGVINVESRRPSFTPEAEAYIEGGPWGQFRLLTSVGNGWGSHAFRADVNVNRADGWRDATAYDRQSASLRWDYYFAGGATLRSLATFTRIEQAGPSSLLTDDYENNPRANYTPISTRSVRAARVSSAFEKETGSTLFSITPYLRWNEMDLLPYWALTYDPTIYTTGHSSVGFVGRVRRDVESLRLRLIGGVDFDWSPGSRLEDRLQTERDGQRFVGYTRAGTLYDYDVTFRGISPYLQLEANPVDRLHVSAGLRVDDIRYDYENRLGPLDEGNWRRPASTDVHFNHVSPKLGASFDVGRGLNVYANYSHGFRAPSEGQIFRQGAAENTIDLQPVTADSYEMGVRGEVGGRVGYTVAAYRMTVANDILTFAHEDGTRETQNAGETLHTGVEAGIGLVILEGLRADLGASVARHTYEVWKPRGDVDYSGNEIQSAPESLYNVRLAYSPS
ncbi:MAG TPA: TonB-dependent receptor, partial [Longimicrobiales bacterium]|nr:TonB-dependent receptor [Longimicrobiales bacterium]